ncbi:uncharacterized protein LOC135127053 [Zophobas morio]
MSVNVNVCITKNLSIILKQTSLDRARTVETIDFTRQRDDSKRCCRTSFARVVSRGGGGGEIPLRTPWAKTLTCGGWDDYKGVGFYLGQSNFIGVPISYRFS